ncbi:DUF368 domain-containing protein [Coprobacter sp.]
MTRNIKEYVVLTLKGMGMGAADVVPGVSGGTIAFIVGIYEELINSIKSVDFKTLKLFFTLKWGSFWKSINGNFLFSVLFGILISVFSLAKLITFLLDNYPVLVWAFFFGLVIASTYFVSKRIEIWDWKRWLSFIIGALMAYYITVATPSQTPETLPFIFLCGAIAICAMILPGISGSFILLLLGKYEFIMNAVKSLDITIIIVFACGAAIGLVLFSNVLSFLLRKFHDITIALLTGFMLGSLNKVWPWKETLETFIDSHGIAKPLVEQNILPNIYIWQAIALMIVGFLLVYVIEKISDRNAKTN